MASRSPPPPGNAPPPKPWELAGISSGPVPFKPPSAGSTSDVVEASGTAKPGETVSNVGRIVPTNVNSLGRPIPPRPWQQSYGSTYGGGYGSGYGSGMYGSYGGFGGGSGLYGNSMFSRPGYEGMLGGSGMYGGGLYNRRFGGPSGGYGMGMDGFYGNQDPNNPFGPPSPPGFWMSFLRVMHGVVDFCGRMAMLIDQNTHAFHLFISALLQLFDRSGLLYGELARFVLRILGIRTKPRKSGIPGPGEVASLDGPGQLYIEAPKGSGSSWDNVWGGAVKGGS